jgi:predicted transcriptional regulator of viral defense system
MVTKSVAKNTNNRKGLSKKEAYLLSSLSEKKKQLFAIKDIIKELECSYNYAKVIVNRLAKKKWVLSLEKGKYLIVPLEAGKESIYTEHEFIIASELAQPYYIAYWSALNYYGMTEQVPFTVFVATTKRRNNKRIHGLSYEFVTLSSKKFFGYTTVNISGRSILISDREKTIVDCLDHMDYCGDITEAAKALWNAREELDFEKLFNYALKMENGAILKRLGYLLEKLKIKITNDFNKKLKNNISKGYNLLDITKKKKGKYSSEWNLRINISDKDLAEWMMVH